MALLSGGNSPKYSQYTSDQFSGNGSTLVYTLSRTPPTASSAIITIDGVKQHSNTYGIVGDQLTFSEAPPNGTAIEVVHLGVTGLAYVPTDSSVTTPKIVNGSVTKEKIDVANGNGSGALNIPYGTDAQKPSGSIGYARVNQTTSNLEVYMSDSLGWKNVVFKEKLGTISNPAMSAQAIIEAGDSTGDGVYYIQSTSGVIQTYCDMTNGGYMLAAKMGTSQIDNWSYSGSNWTTYSPVNESGCQTLNDEAAVNRLYYEYNIFNSLRLCLGSKNNALVYNYNGNARSIFNGSQRTTSYGRAAWLSWYSTGTGRNGTSDFSTQPNSNVEGFNVTSATACALRFGITFNNEADSLSNDAAIAMGGYTNNIYTPGAGVRNENAGGHTWNPDGRYVAVGYIFVK